MQEQNYANHRQLVPLTTLCSLASGVDADRIAGQPVQSLGSHARLYSASLIVVLVVTSLMIALFCRVFRSKRRIAPSAPRRICGTMC